MSVAEIRTRLGSNLQRVEGLAALSEWIEFPARNDLLRASVVLRHATLEDVLRSILELRLPTATPEHLAMLKFAVADRSKDHLSMSELAKHRGKTVDQLIGERIEAYLERSTSTASRMSYTRSSELGSRPTCSIPTRTGLRHSCSADTGSSIAPIIFVTPRCPMLSNFGPSK